MLIQSGILLKETGITNGWIHWQRIRNPVPGMRNPRLGIQNPRLSWILLHEAIRIVGKDGNEAGKICTLTDMFCSNFLPSYHAKVSKSFNKYLKESQRSNNLAKIYVGEAIHPCFFFLRKND